MATHRDLEERVKEGLFRQDLFYRLAVVPIHLPPLRDRTDDIAGLCEIFCDQAATELKMPRRRLSATSLEKLRHYRFPGNLRELRNLIERAYILTSNLEIGEDDLPLPQKEGTSARVNGIHADRLTIPFSTPSTSPSCWRALRRTHPADTKRNPGRHRGGGSPHGTFPQCLRI